MPDLRRLVSLETFRRVIVVAGLAAIGVLLWKLDPRVVLHTVSRAGFGIALIIPLEMVAQFFNAIGWRLSFRPDEARAYRLAELWKLWLAMEGINYLVPTGTVAGEVARAAMLSDAQPPEVRTASVLVSRIGPTIAHITVILAGFVFLVSDLPLVAEHRWIAIAAETLLAIVAVATLVYALIGHRWIAARAGDGQTQTGLLRAMPHALRTYFGAHPWRFLASIAIFAAGYIWPAFEAWWICRLIGVPIGAITALTIEALSLAIDGALFMVPAKIGTQELGKTAIFSLLGLPLSAGLAFGIIRHLRELFWALTGFAIYSTWKRDSHSSKS